MQDTNNSGRISTGNLEQLEGGNEFEGSPTLFTYIRPLRLHEGFGYAVCTEQGVVMGTFNSSESAYYSARQFHLEPQLLH